MKQPKTSAESNVAVASGTTPATQLAQPAALPQPADEAAYFQSIRPMFAARGCDAQPCHGMPKGGGLFLAGGNTSKANFAHVLAQIDVQQPSNSKLYRKAVGLEPHNGGRNIDAQSCDGRMLLAWLQGAPLPSCAPAVTTHDDFARVVVPALHELGCAADSCHGDDRDSLQAKRVRRAFDLTAVAGAPDTHDYDRARKHFEQSGLLPVTPWMSPVLRAARGLGAAAHRNQREVGCAYIKLYRYIALAPIGAETCVDTTEEVSRRVRRFADFNRAISGTIIRRGCTDTSCHGGGAGDLALFESTAPDAQWHNFLVLDARVDHVQPEQSLVLRKARNSVEHGGGQRLGGLGDCRDDMLLAWAQGAPVSTCQQRPAPSKERFAREVQPVLERMTCTRAACHGRGQRKFYVVAKPNRAQLERNYRQTLAEIDLEFTPLSGVMLRMREPCAYATVTAWIDNRPSPDCVARDPDPKIFPRIDDAHPDSDDAHPTDVPM